MITTSVFARKLQIGNRFVSSFLGEQHAGPAITAIKHEMLNNYGRPATHQNKTTSKWVVLEFEDGTTRSMPGNLLVVVAADEKVGA